VRYHQAILVSCQIPWDENEELMEDLFREEIRMTLRRGLRDLYIFGTAGEGYAVDRARFERIATIFREETSIEGVFPQVGVIGLSTAAVKERISFAYALGFRMFQISLPSWGAVNDREMMRFFTGVCGAYPDARFLHYNLPRTKRVLTAKEYRAIADAVPNLAATKNTGTTVQSTAELMKAVPEIQHFFGEYMFPTGCLYGECSLLSSFAPMIPRKSLEFFECCRGGGIENMFRTQKDYMAMVEEILAPMRRQTLMDGAYDKLLLRLGGFPMPLRLLSPYDSFSEDVYEECRQILHGKYADRLG
jgi:dihydrodipicolinate synthase/N-acetylneuraminate lyase